MPFAEELLPPNLAEEILKNELNINVIIFLKNFAKGLFKVSQNIVLETTNS